MLEILILIFVAVIAYFAWDMSAALANVKNQLNIVEENLTMKMNQQEQHLNEAINSLTETSVNGFESLQVEVKNATDRVIGKLEERDIDLSDEIKMLTDLSSVVSNRTQETVSSLQGIAPASADVPTEEPPAEETPAEEPADVDSDDDAEESDDSSEDSSEDEDAGDSADSEDNSEAETAELPKEEDVLNEDVSEVVEG